MILVAVRCRNEEKNIPRFLRCYDWADKILVSDGGSTDRSLDLLEGRVDLIHFSETETRGGEMWNPDNPHIQFLLDAAKSYNPDWIIYEDMDSVPNYLLQQNGRNILETCQKGQVNVFRLYLWGDKQYFPYMNRDFNPDYRSLWAWKPSEVNIHTDLQERHGTILGTIKDFYPIELPNCLLHYSYDPATIDAKVARYNKLGLTMVHPMVANEGGVRDLPEWAHI